MCAYGVNFEWIIPREATIFFIQKKTDLKSLSCHGPKILLSEWTPKLQKKTDLKSLSSHGPKILGTEWTKTILKYTDWKSLSRHGYLIEISWTNKVKKL